MIARNGSPWTAFRPNSTIASRRPSQSPRSPPHGPQACLTGPDPTLPYLTYLNSRPALSTKLLLASARIAVSNASRDNDGAFCQAWTPASGSLALGSRGTVCSRPGLSSARDAAGRIRFEPRVDAVARTSRGKHMAEANQNDISESFAQGRGI